MLKMFLPQRRWQIHLCATTPDQRLYVDTLTAWLRKQGHTILAAPDASLAARIAAARASEVCLLLLGPEYGVCEPHASFTATELEAYAALESGANKLLVFSQPDVERAHLPEQREFISRMRDFVAGTFQATIATPNDLPAAVRTALDRMEALERAAEQDLSRAIMISSTGDLIAERERLRDLLTHQRYPIIDYQIASSETTTPIERVTAWASQCRALLLVLGKRYGYISPVDGLGVTELEFVSALNAGRPILALIRPDALDPDDPDQRQFVERVRYFLPPERIRICHTLDDLERAAYRSLRDLLNSAKAPAIPTITEKQARAWYQRQVQRWLGTLPHPHNPAGVPFTTMPLLLVNEPMTAREAIDKTDSRMARIAAEKLSLIATIEPDVALAQTPRLVIMGPSGAGKSAILHWYALRAAQTTERIPTLIALPAYARARRAGLCDSLLTYLEQEERRLLLTAPGTPSYWRVALEAGCGLLLLDDWSALDDAARELVAHDITACSAVLPQTTPIVLAQRETVTSQPAYFTPLYVLPLLQAQLQEIAFHWIEAARQVEDLDEQSATQLYRNVWFQARGENSYTTWARTPRLLTALISVLYVSNQRTIGALRDGVSALLRRVLRIILTTPQRPQQLWEKERFLLEIASRMLSDPPPEDLPEHVLRAAWQAVAPAADQQNQQAMENLLHELSAFLTFQGGSWRYLHPAFGVIYSAAALAAKSEAERIDHTMRHRLYQDWAHVPAVVAGELDRLGRVAEADALIGALLTCDAAPVLDSGGVDPFHVALASAVSAQGGRATANARGGHGSEIARRLGDILHQDTLETAGTDKLSMANDITWLLLLLGPAAAECIDELAATLDNPQSFYARTILNSLASDGDERAQAVIDANNARQTPLPRTYASLETLIEQAREQLRSNEQERMFAAMSLSCYGPRASSAVPDLIPLLASKDSQTRLRAVEALAAIGLGAAPALPHLLDLALHDPEEGLTVNSSIPDIARIAVMRLQGWATPEQVRSVGAGLLSGDKTTAARAASALAALGPLAMPFIADIIRVALNPDPGYSPAKWYAAAALIALGPEAIAAINSAIAAILENPDSAWAERYAVVNIIPALRSHAAPLLGPLLAVIYRQDDRLRTDAIYALGYLAEAAVPALPDLRALLASSTRNSSLGAIETLGPLARPLRDDVLAVLGDESPAIRSQAYTAVRAMNLAMTPEIEHVALSGLQDVSPHVRDSAAKMAGHLRPMTPRVTSALLRTYYATVDNQAIERFYSLSIRSYVRDCLFYLWDAGIPSFDAPVL